MQTPVACFIVLEKTVRGWTRNTRGYVRKTVPRNPYYRDSLNGHRPITAAPWSFVPEDDWWASIQLLPLCSVAPIFLLRTIFVPGNLRSRDFQITSGTKVPWLCRLVNFLGIFRRRFEVVEFCDFEGLKMTRWHVGFMAVELDLGTFKDTGLVVARFSGFQDFRVVRVFWISTLLRNLEEFAEAWTDVVCLSVGIGGW